MTDDQLVEVIAKTFQLLAARDAAAAKPRRAREFTGVARGMADAILRHYGNDSDALERPAHFADVILLVGEVVDVMKELAERIAAVEDRGISYEGVYGKAQAYRRGSAVTEAGSLWIALRAVEPGEIPGAAPTAWKLAVKRGADGKDAR